MRSIKRAGSRRCESNAWLLVDHETRVPDDSPVYWCWTMFRLHSSDAGHSLRVRLMTPSSEDS